MFNYHKSRICPSCGAPLLSGREASCPKCHYVFKPLQQENEEKKETEDIETNINEHEKSYQSIDIQKNQVIFNRKKGYPFDLTKGKFVSIDFETTGLYSDDRIVEVAAVLFENGIPTSSYSSLMNPGISIPSETSNYNHITNDMLSTAPTPKKVIRDLITFIDNNTIVAYNADFDIGFLKRELIMQGIDYQNDYYDVYESVKNYYRGDFPDRKQTTIAKHMDISIDNAHRALCDAEVCGKILVNIEPWVEKCKEYDRLADEQYYKDRTPTDEQRELCAIINDLLKKNNGYYYLVRYKVFRDSLYLHCRKKEIAFYFSKKGIRVDVPKKYTSNCEQFIIDKREDNVSIRINNPFDIYSIENYLLDLTNLVGRKYDNLSEKTIDRVNDEIENSGFEISEGEVTTLIKNAKERCERKKEDEKLKKKKKK